MADGDLTERQIAFLEAFIGIPKYFGRGKAKRKRAEYEVEFARFNVQRDAVRQRIDALPQTDFTKRLHEELRKAEDIIEAGGKTPDFAGGHKHLVVVNNIVELEKLKAVVRAKLDEVQPLVEAALAGNLDKHDEIEAVWVYAEEHARTGLDSSLESHLNQALPALRKLPGLILSAAPASTDAAAGVKAAAPDGMKARQDLALARALWTQTQTRKADTKARLDADFDAAVPTALGDLLAEAGALLDAAPDEEGGMVEDLAEETRKIAELAAAIRKSAEDAAAKLDELDTAATPLHAAYKAWIAAIEAFVPRLATLNRHTLRTHPKVQPRVQAVNDAEPAARAKADAFNYTDATTDITAALDDCEAVITLADDWSTLLQVLNDRKKRIESLADPADVDHQQAKDAINAAKELYKTGGQAFQAGDMRRATDNLDPIPAAVEKAIWLTKLSQDYTSDYTAWGTRLTALEDKSDEVKAALDPDLARERQLWTDSACAADGDIEAAMQKLALFNWSVNSLEARAKEAGKYYAAVQPFEDRLKAVKDLKGEGGRIAIEAYYQRLKKDKDFATDKADAKEFAAARKTLKSSEGIHADMLALAAIGKDHLKRKKEIGETLDDLGGKDGADKVAAPIERVRALVASAWTTAQGGDWKGSIETLKEAQKQLDLASDLIDDAAEIVEATKGGELDAVNDDETFAAAFAVYKSVYDTVSGKDDGTFATKLQAISMRALGISAKAEAGGKALTEAAGELKQLVAECEAILQAIGLKKGYADRLASVEAAHAALNTAEKNTDDCIKPDLDEIKALIDEAKEMVKPPALDFGGADARLSTAFTKIRQAEINAAAYAKLNEDKVKIEELKTYLSDNTRKDGVDKEIDRLDTILAAIESAKTARDLKTAAAKAKEGAALDTGYRAIADAYVKAKAVRKEKLTDQLHFIQGKPACAIELAEVNDLDAQIGKLFEARTYGVAEKLANKAANLIVKGYYLDQDFNAWTPVRTQAETEMADFAGRHKDKVIAATEKKPEIDEAWAAALKAVDERNFKKAKTLGDKVVALCTGMKEVLDAFEACEVKRQEAEALLGQVDTLANKDAVEPLVARLRGKHDNAVRAEDGARTKEDFKAVEDVFDEIKTDCQTALDTAAELAADQTEIDDIKALAETDTDGLKTAMDTAQAALDKLKALPDSYYIHPDLVAAQLNIDSARKLIADAGGEAAAKQKLLDAMDDCARGRINLGHFAQLNRSAEFVRDRVKEFLDNHPQQAFIADLMTALRDEVNDLMVDLRGDPQKRSATQDRIEEIMVEFHRLRGIADAHDLYLPKRDAVENDILVMEAHKLRATIKDELKLVRNLLASADESAARHDHTKAMSEIDTARRTQVDALLRADMEKGDTPTPERLKALLDSPGGSDRLDKIMENLDPASQRKVVHAAFEARYGCDLKMFKDKSHEDAFEAWLKLNPDADEATWKAQRDLLRAGNISPDLGKKAPNIMRLYKAMEDLPDSDTLDNESMLVFSNVEGPAKGSDYNGGFKEITMREGAFDTSGFYGIARKNELEETDANCEPAEGDLLTFFDWNTLHEVGHAVDDRASFMDRNGKTHGGWEIYGANVLPVAEAVAGHIGFDAGYIAAYMSGTAEPPIPEPDGCDDEEWERRRVASRIWIDRAREGNNPWQTAAAAKMCVIDKTVYQESYENTWTSYPYDARKQGVSGYQFRAPGEWFSELYAAYHSGRMNANHPARAWLDTL